MTKKNQSQRDISFLSSKNGKVVTVHSALARQVAKSLETDSRVFSYQVDVPLTNIPETISVVGLRETYLTTEWVVDFLVSVESGRVIAIDVASEEELEKKAVAEKLEIARRYWKKTVDDWRLVIVKEGETKW